MEKQKVCTYSFRQHWWWDSSLYVFVLLTKPILISAQSNIICLITEVLWLLHCKWCQKSFPFLGRSNLRLPTKPYIALVSFQKRARPESAWYTKVTLNLLVISKFPNRRIISVVAASTSLIFSKILSVWMSPIFRSKSESRRWATSIFPRSLFEKFYYYRSWAV